MKKIIGTGLTGLVGSRIAEVLAREYHWVDFSLNSGINILSYQKLESAFKAHQDASAVIHLAAFTDTTKAHEERGNENGLCYQLNVLGTKNIIACCQRFNKRLIHFSTDFVFSGNKETDYSEEDSPDPIDWYGQTKAEAEKAVLASDLVWAIVRIAFPYRASFPDKPDVVRKILEGLKTGKLYPMFADQIITPTFIDDIAQGIDTLLTTNSQGIFHLVGSESLSPYDLAKKIAKNFDFDPQLVKKGSLADYRKSLPPDSRPYQPCLRLANEKISRLGVKMSDINTGLARMKNQLDGSD